MKIYKILFLSALLFCVLSCTMMRRLERREASAGISLIREKQAETPKEAYKPNYTRVARPLTGDSVYWGEAVTDSDGQRVMSVDLQEVEVVAKSRVVVERLGKVAIDFRITVPEELQSKCFGIVITPRLQNNGADTPLEKLVIRGGLYSRVQERDFWQFDKYRSRLLSYRSDTAYWNGRIERAYRQLVKFPYATDARLDSVVSQNETIVYYYSQDVKTEDTGKQLSVTLDGRVQALDGSSYRLPPSDTIKYTISSMLSFVDTLPRYQIKVIDKYAVVRDRNFVTFRANDTAIADTLGDNRRQLDRIVSLMDSLINQEEFYIDSITLTASSSPEGPYVRNDALARDRGYALRDYLSGHFGRQTDTMITVRRNAEDWTELDWLILGDDSIDNREPIRRIIESEHNPDIREKQIRERHPQDYAYIRRKLYPQLRSVAFKYNLRRRGMIQDTVHTTEPDTLYARGVELLKRRSYTEAMNVLYPYRDRNSVIALLSLGYDRTSYEIVRELPAGPENDYLHAIVAMRLDLRDEAAEHFARAAEAEPRMKFRARLDPELTELVQ